MSALWPVQKAVYETLNAALSVGVYSLGNVPEGLDATYTVVGESTAEADDTDDRLGFSVVTTVHTWDTDDNSRGFNNVKPLMGEIYTALHRVNLSVSGYTVTDCFFEFEQVNIDADGLTAHGAQRVRVLLTTN